MLQSIAVGICGLVRTWSTLPVQQSSAQAQPICRRWWRRGHHPPCMCGPTCLLALQSTAWLSALQVKLAWQPVQQERRAQPTCRQGSLSPRRKGTAHLPPWQPVHQKRTGNVQQKHRAQLTCRQWWSRGHHPLCICRALLELPAGPCSLLPGRRLLHSRGHSRRWHSAWTVAICMQNRDTVALPVAQPM